MFMQVDRSTRRSQGGLGIGLTLVRSLVGMHGGSVEATKRRARAGQRIHRAAAAARRGRRCRAETSRRIQPLPSRRILIVDDSRDGGESLAMLLRVLGAEVSLAHSGRDALDCIEQLPPRRRAARHRHARHGWLRSGAAHSRQSEQPPHLADRVDRLGPGRRSPALDGGRIQSSSRQARRHRSAPPAAHGRIGKPLHTFGAIAAPIAWENHRVSTESLASFLMYRAA